MKRCKCGNEEFNCRQVRHYDIVVSGDSCPYWQRDGEAPDNPYECSAPMGDFECISCGEVYLEWCDIPDLEE